MSQTVYAHLPSATLLNIGSSRRVLEVVRLQWDKWKTGVRFSYVNARSLRDKVPDVVDYTVNESTDEFLIVVSRQQLSKINIESITVGESVIKQV